jgi:hypothetical protein
LPSELAARVIDPLAWRQTLARLARQSLARIDHRGLQMHRLTQAILRDLLVPAQAATTRARTEAILAAGNPGEPADPSTWPRWARLMPHMLFADLAATDSPSLRQLACDACSYLLARRDTWTCHPLASDLRQRWRDRLGDDHEHVRAITRLLDRALRAIGRYAEARELAQDTLDRDRRILGEDHPDTLISATNLAIDLRYLGEVEAARDLDQDTLDRRRRILGEDHPITLRSARNLAADLRGLRWARGRKGTWSGSIDNPTLSGTYDILGCPGTILDYYLDEI